MLSTPLHTLKTPRLELVVMRGLTFRLRLESDLGTPMRGDTLFGQLCWMLRLTEEEAALTRALAGYTEGEPFLIVSDACPAGFLPKPEISAPPISEARLGDTREWIRRKAWSARKWLPARALSRPLIEAWRDDNLERGPSPSETIQPHNTINRLTGTTGVGVFAPYQTAVTVFARDAREIEVHCLHDPDRLTDLTLSELMRRMGLSGFGRDASIGLGKFRVEGSAPTAFRAGAYAVTLAPCRPAPGEADEAKSYWRPFTRFGRHGGAASAGQVFKAPVLLADSGALLRIEEAAMGRAYVGTGLGGDGRLSRQIRATVGQAYAPVLPVDLEGWHG